MRAMDATCRPGIYWPAARFPDPGTKLAEVCSSSHGMGASSFPCLRARSAVFSMMGMRSWFADIASGLVGWVLVWVNAPGSSRLRLGDKSVTVMVLQPGGLCRNRAPGLAAGAE